MPQGRPVGFDRHVKTDDAAPVDLVGDGLVDYEQDCVAELAERRLRVAGRHSRPPGSANTGLLRRLCDG